MVKRIPEVCTRDLRHRVGKVCHRKVNVYTLLYRRKRSFSFSFPLSSGSKDPRVRRSRFFAPFLVYACSVLLSVDICFHSALANDRHNERHESLFLWHFEVEVVLSTRLLSSTKFSFVCRAPWTELITILKIAVSHPPPRLYPVRSCPVVFSPKVELPQKIGNPTREKTVQFSLFETLYTDNCVFKISNERKRKQKRM